MKTSALNTNTDKGGQNPLLSATFFIFLVLLLWGALYLFKDIVTQELPRELTYFFTF